MKLLTLKLFFIIVYSLSSSATYSIEHPKIKNLIIHKEAKNLSNIEFKNSNKDTITLSNYKNKLTIINFWATWCAPCREEMPSLAKLKESKVIKNIEILPINVGQESISKSLDFFNEININNLNVYFDPSSKLPKTFLLRGLPTSVFINKDGKEFARIVGAVDFQDSELIEWLKKFE